MYNKNRIDEEAEREAESISKHNRLIGRIPRHAKPGKLMVGSKFDPPEHNMDRLWDDVVLRLKEVKIHKYDILGVE